MDKCEDNQYFVKNGDKTYCYASCPKEYPFVDSDNGKECKSTCAAGIYKDDGVKKVCQTTCEDKYYLADSEIVSDKTYFKCAAAGDCSDIYKVTQKIGDDTNTYCYATSCPADHPYIESDAPKECKEKCKSGVKYFYIENDNKVCAEKCSTGHEYLNGNECVSRCPDNTFL